MQTLRRWLPYVAFLALAVVPQLRADDTEDFDAYTIRFEGFWFYARPTGSFSGTQGNGSFSLQGDVHFESYSTFQGKVDWKFTRKNHLYFTVSPFDKTKQFVGTRTVTFQGQTFDVGVSTTAELKTNVYAPGYQYDIIRRKRGNLGVQVQLNIADLLGSLSANAQVVNGVPHFAHRAEGSLRAPLPIAGPTLRFYLLPNSRRLFVDGNVLGMYFFGYGSFLSTFDTLGLSAGKHFSIRAGYRLAQRLNINNTQANRIGLNLTQKGAVVGAEFSF